MQSEIAKEDWEGLVPGDIVAETYRVERVIGRGGNGVVAEASRQEDGKKVAIKVMRPDPDGDGEAVTRFLFEAKAASQMKSVHIAKVLDVGSLTSGEPYFVMEFLEGHDLDAALRGEGIVTVETACDYVLQTCEALAEAHAGGIVHGDVKPRNLFLTLTPGGIILVKLLDFGISKHAPADITTDMRTTKTHWPVMGTPLYMAPEQMRSTRRVDHRADIWALGVVLHECLTGQMPFVGASLSEVAAAIAADAPVKCRAQRPDLPVEVEEIILRCLEKDPEARFANVAELASALLPFGPPNAALTEKRISMVLSAASRVTAPPPRRSMFPSMPTPFMPIIPSRLPSLAPPPPPTDEVDAGWNEDAPPALVAAPAADEALPEPAQAEAAPHAAAVADVEPPLPSPAEPPPVETFVPASEAETPFVPAVEETPALALRVEEAPTPPAEDVPPPRVRVVSVPPLAHVPAFEASPPKKQGPGVWIGLVAVAAVAALAFFLTRPAPPPPVAAPTPPPPVTAATTVTPPPPPAVASEAARPAPPPPPPPVSAEPAPSPSPSTAPAVATSETTPKSERSDQGTSRSSSRASGRHHHEHETTKTTSTTPAPAGTAAFGGSRE